MLCCAASFVVAAYAKVRLIPHDMRASPAAFLQSRLKLNCFSTFYDGVKVPALIGDFI
jgi:hypothetical protein